MRRVHVRTTKRRSFQEFRTTKARINQVYLGNVSAFDKETGYLSSNLAGVSYDEMKASDMVVVDLENTVIEGELNPSSDTPTPCSLISSLS